MRLGEGGENWEEALGERVDLGGFVGVFFGRGGRRGERVERGERTYRLCRTLRRFLEGEG